MRAGDLFQRGHPSWRRCRRHAPAAAAGWHRNDICYRDAWPLHHRGCLGIQVHIRVKGRYWLAGSLHALHQGQKANQFCTMQPSINEADWSLICPARQYLGSLSDRQQGASGQSCTRQNDEKQLDLDHPFTATFAAQTT